MATIFFLSCLDGSELFILFEEVNKIKDLQFFSGFIQKFRQNRKPLIFQIFKERLKIWVKSQVLGYLSHKH